MNLVYVYTVVEALLTEEAGVIAAAPYGTCGNRSRFKRRAKKLPLIYYDRLSFAWNSQYTQK